MNARMDRISEQFRQEIAMIIHRELKDPRLGFVTITTVEVSRDLSYAKVGYSCLGTASDRESSQEALESSAGYIRELLKKRLRLKTIPQPTFRYDASIEGSIRMSDTFERLKEKQEESG